MVDPRSEVGTQEVLRLSEKEIDYLKSGESGNYSEKELDRRIQQKVDKLPERFEILFDDIKALYKPQYSYGGDEPEEIEIVDRMELIRAFLSVCGPDVETPIPEEQFHSLYQWEGTRKPRPHGLGFKLGTMVSYMMMYSKEKEPIETGTDTVLGFLEGLRTGPLPAGGVDGDKILEEVKEISSRLEEKAEKSAEAKNKQREWFSKLSDQPSTWERAQSQVREVLEERDLRKSSEDRLRQGLFEESEGSYVLKKAPVDIDLVMGFLRDEHGRNYTTNITEEQGIVTMGEIHEVIEEHDLEQEIGFWKTVQDDKSKVEETSWSNGSAKEVLKMFKDGRATATEIARGLSDTSLGNVPETEQLILPELSGTSEGSAWNERPLITKEGECYRLTAYGRLLRYVFFEHTGMWGSVHNVPEELVNEAMSETELY